MAGSLGGKSLVKPGYHIRPKYDLHGLRHRRTDDHKGHVAGELPLTSMIDMFSILVLYLLMNFSATGEVFFANKNLPLPKSASTNPMLNAPLLSVVGDRFVLDAPPDYGSTGPIEDTTTGLPRIVAGLKSFKQIADSKKIDSQGRINLQASQDAPLLAVKRAMTAAVIAGWTNINFVVEKE